MSFYDEIYPPVETVLEMEPEELAPIVLKHLARPGQGKLNLHNFTIGTGADFVQWAGEDNRKKRRDFTKICFSLAVARTGVIYCS